MGNCHSRTCCSQEGVCKCMLIGAGAAGDLFSSTIVLMRRQTHKYNDAEKYFLSCTCANQDAFMYILSGTVHIV